MTDNTLAIPEIQDTKVPPAIGISAVALNMALKWFDINMVKDGTLYQQYKIEGRNMIAASIPEVIEVAKQFEVHLMAAPGRMSELLAGVILDTIDDLIPTHRFEYDQRDEESLALTDTKTGKGVIVEGEEAQTLFTMLDLNPGQQDAILARYFGEDEHPDVTEPEA